MKPLLSVQNVTKDYPLPGGNSLRAVNHVDLSVAENENIAIVGESGCGKSTLARMILKVEAVTEGGIFFDGEDITKASRKERRELYQKMQMIFQDPHSVFSPRMKIREFLMEPYVNYLKFSRREAEARALASLQAVGLSEEHFRKYPHQLSGGQLQRVSIARAIALDVKLLVCDEITSALDVSVQKQILELLKAYRDKRSFASIFICHDLALAENYCQRIYVMYLGTVMEILPGRHLRQNAQNPYTKSLLDSVFSIHQRTRDQKEKKRPENAETRAGDGCPFFPRCPEAVPDCANTMPELRETEAGHFCRCHMIETEIGEGLG